jgi:rubrerythrin
VVLPESGGGNGMDTFVDVAEVEVGDVRSSSPVKIDTASAIAARLKANAAMTDMDGEDSPQGGEFHICRICNQFVPVSDIADHNHEHHGAVSDMTCLDCGKIFKSKRSLFGHRKEKHSGVTEVHSCPECGKTFGRKSNLKAHRESLHYGKKFPCQLCDRIFTNRSSMNQHIKKTHNVAGINLDDSKIII